MDCASGMIEDAKNKYFTEMLVDSLTRRLNLVFHSVAVFSIQQTCKIECWLGKLDSLFHGVAGWSV